MPIGYTVRDMCYAKIRIMCRLSPGLFFYGSTHGDGVFGIYVWFVHTFRWRGPHHPSVMCRPTPRQSQADTQHQHDKPNPNAETRRQLVWKMCTSLLSVNVWITALPAGDKTLRMRKAKPSSSATSRAWWRHDQTRALVDIWTLPDMTMEHLLVLGVSQWCHDQAQSFPIQVC